jgi:hypothetical protein
MKIKWDEEEKRRRRRCNDTIKKKLDILIL